MSNRIILTSNCPVHKNFDRRTNGVTPNVCQTPIQKNQAKSDAAEQKFLTEKNVEQIRKKLERAAELLKDAQLSEIARKNVAKEALVELERRQTSIKFEFENELEELVVKIVRKGTGEVVWQYPPYQTLALQRLAKYMPGIFLNTLI